MGVASIWLKRPKNQRSPSLESKERIPLTGKAALSNHDTSIVSN